VENRFCDDFGSDGFGWTVGETMARTSHALAVDGRVWLVDPVDWPEAIERTRTLGEPVGVIQLLDRHNRDCAAIAARLDVPHLLTPDELPGSPFTVVSVVRRKHWRESALWWPQTRTLAVAEALGTNRFYTAGKAPVAVHLVLRLTPPRMLGAYRPDRLLVGHGGAVSGPETADAIDDALRTSRRGLPGALASVPFARSSRA
jgi:hypothetical protein